MRIINFSRLIILVVLSGCFALNTVGQDVDLDELLEMDLERMVEIQSTGRGDVGSFGYRLGDIDSKFQLHGYSTNEYIDIQEKVSTFDNHYYNVFIGSSIGKKIFAEIQLEYEHGGEEIQARYAQIDYKVSDAFIIRTGKFLVPINTFNEYLYPEYINKTISRPFINRNVTPTAWAEVGLQFRGNFNFSDNVGGFYSAYVVNGLEGDEGGDIRSFRNNHRDKNSGNKAVGGRFGINTGGFEIGSGFYTGAYTADGEHNLSIIALDAGYAMGSWTIRAEYNTSSLGTSTGDITRSGAAVSASYVIADLIEPVLRYDYMKWDDPADPTKDKSRIYLGANYLISSTMNFKVGYELINNDGTDVDDNVLAFQLALGF